MEDYSKLKGKHFKAWDLYAGKGVVEVFVADIDFGKGITIKYSDLEDRNGDPNYFCLNKDKCLGRYKERFDYMVAEIKKGKHNKSAVDNFRQTFQGKTLEQPCSGGMIVCAFE